MSNHLPLSAYPGFTPLPSDPYAPLSPEQLAALFPDPAANQRFVSLIAELAIQSQLTLTPGAVPEGAANGR